MTKKNLIYRLLKRLDSKELSRFKDFAVFYFNKEDSYLIFLDLVLTHLKTWDKKTKFPEAELIRYCTDTVNFFKKKTKLKKCLTSFLRHQSFENPKKVDSLIACRDLVNLDILYLNEELKIYELELKKVIKKTEKADNFVFLPMFKASYTNYCAYYNRDKNAIQNLHKNLKDFQISQENYSLIFECMVLFDDFVLNHAENNSTALEDIFNRFNEIYDNTSNNTIQLLCLRGFAGYYKFKNDKENMLIIQKKAMPLFNNNSQSQFFLELKESLITEFFFISITFGAKEEATYFLSINDEIYKKYNYSNYKYLDEFLYQHLYYTYIFIDDKEEIKTKLKWVKNQKKQYKLNYLQNSSNSYLQSESICLYKINEYEECNKITDYLIYKNKFINEIVLILYIYSAFQFFDNIRLNYVFRNLKRIIISSKINKLLYLKKILNDLHHLKNHKTSITKNEFKISYNEILKKLEDKTSISDSNTILKILTLNPSL